MELSILIALAKGRQSKEIATQIRRSPATVEQYVKHLRAKFDAQNRIQLVAFALAVGVIQPSDVADRSDH